MEVVSASGVRDPEYRVGDFVKSRLQRNAPVNLYVGITFGEQIAHTMAAEADESGKVVIGQTVSFPLAKPLRDGVDSQIMIRAYDKRDQAQSSHKGDPLIGKAKICLGEVPYGTPARKSVDLERDAQQKKTLRPSKMPKMPEDSPETSSTQGPVFTGNSGEQSADPAAFRNSGDSQVHGVILLEYTVLPPPQNPVDMTLCVRKPWKALGICGP